MDSDYELLSANPAHDSVTGVECFVARKFHFASLVNVSIDIGSPMQAVMVLDSVIAQGISILVVANAGI